MKDACKNKMRAEEKRRKKEYETPSGFFQERERLGPIPNRTSPYCLMKNQYSNSEGSQPHCTISSCSPSSQSICDEFSQCC